MNLNLLLSAFPPLDLGGDTDPGELAVDGAGASLPAVVQVEPEAEAEAASEQEESALSAALQSEVTGVSSSSLPLFSALGTGVVISSMRLSLCPSWQLRLPLEERQGSEDVPGVWPPPPPPPLPPPPGPTPVTTKQPPPPPTLPRLLLPALVDPPWSLPHLPIGGASEAEAEA